MPAVQDVPPCSALPSACPRQAPPAAQPSRTYPTAPPPSRPYVRRATESEELPSIVWTEPSGSTDSTTPMCSSQTMRSPGWGWAVAAGMALPERWAQAHTSSTRPKPWPASPSGAPAWRAAQETKYAHHGPTPEPAVAWRYWAMRGESLEPGGCSAWPTSPRTAFSTAWPAFVPPPAAGGSTDERLVAAAPWSAPAKLVLDGAAVGPVAGAATGCGSSAVCSDAMRARTASTLTAQAATGAA